MSLDKGAMLAALRHARWLARLADNATCELANFLRSPVAQMAALPNAVPGVSLPADFFERVERAAELLEGVRVDLGLAQADVSEVVP